LRRGDLVTEVNGKPVEAPIAFFDAVRATPPKRLVRITYWRDGDTRVVELPANLAPADSRRRRRLTV
jgi:S1-C subfamily serine protease